MPLVVAGLAHRRVRIKELVCQRSAPDRAHQFGERFGFGAGPRTPVTLVDERGYAGLNDGDRGKHGGRESVKPFQCLLRPERGGAMRVGICVACASRARFAIVDVPHDRGLDQRDVVFHLSGIQPGTVHRASMPAPEVGPLAHANDRASLGPRRRETLEISSRFGLHANVCLVYNNINDSARS